MTPYDSLQEIAAQRFSFIPVRWLLIDKFESWRYVPRITVPTLILVAEQDEVIPRASSQQLYSRFAKGVAKIKIFPGVNHNTVSAHPDYFAILMTGL